MEKTHQQSDQLWGLLKRLTVFHALTAYGIGGCGSLFELCNQQECRSLMIAIAAFTQVWLQHITNTSDDWSGETQPYDMPLCRLVAQQPEPLWNNSWLKKKLAAEFPIESIVDREVLRETGQAISFNERFSYEDMVGDREKCECP